MAEQAVGANIGLQTVAATTGQFSNNFLKVVADEHTGNLICSPLSAQLVLAMVAYGAAGMTAVQMRSALFIPSDDKLGQSGYQSLIESFNSVTSVDLRIANKVFTASRFPVKSAYKTLTAEKFLSASQELDFENSTAAAATINTWCEDQTNKRIKDVLKPDDLDSDTKLVLVNAVYFKGKWEHTFDPLYTRNTPFHINETTTESVPTMYIENKYRYGDLPQLNATFIEMPYQGEKVGYFKLHVTLTPEPKARVARTQFGMTFFTPVGDELSMIIILPNEVDGLKTVQDNLHQLNLKESLQQSDPSKIELFLPKFKIESTLNLEEPLQKLGITEMFTNQANFSGIADVSLKVTKVIQKAFIEVDEEGSKAAAVTAMKMMKTSSKSNRPSFIINRPYYYVIYHGETGVSLFTGFVKKPKLE